LPTSPQIQKLCEQQYPEIEDFEFPNKVWFNNFSEGVIEYRRTRFEAYLTLLLELVNKYPPLRKEVESFLGVPQVINPPKRYPKTPVPGRKVVEKPIGLMDDPSDFASAAGRDLGAKAPTGAGVCSNSQRSLFLSRKRSSDEGLVEQGRGESPTIITTGKRVTSPSPAESSAAAAAARACGYASTTTILSVLLMYIALVFLLALIAALDPSNTRLSALLILGLSSVASLVVMRAFHGAAAQDARRLMEVRSEPRRAWKGGMKWK
jgi:hypothetical protein